MVGWIVEKLSSKINTFSLCYLISLHLPLLFSQASFCLQHSSPLGAIQIRLSLQKIPSVQLFLPLLSIPSSRKLFNLSQMPPRLTQSQKDVLSLYRTGLRLIRDKPAVSVQRSSSIFSFFFVNSRKENLSYSLLSIHYLPFHTYTIIMWHDLALRRTNLHSYSTYGIISNIRVKEVGSRRRTSLQSIT